MQMLLAQWAPGIFLVGLHQISWLLLRDTIPQRHENPNKTLSYINWLITGYSFVQKNAAPSAAMVSFNLLFGGREEIPATAAHVDTHDIYNI